MFIQPSLTFRAEDSPSLGLFYRIRKTTDSVSYHTFHTADDLEGLPIDASLKKICKALGSRRFLTEISDEATVDTVRDRSMEANRETTVTFEPRYDGVNFFDAYGKGRVEMTIYQSSNGESADLYCDFFLLSKKKAKMYP